MKSLSEGCDDSEGEINKSGLDEMTIGSKKRMPSWKDYRLSDIELTEPSGSYFDVAPTNLLPEVIDISLIGNST